MDAFCEVCVTTHAAPLDESALFGEGRSRLPEGATFYGGVLTADQIQKHYAVGIGLKHIDVEKRVAEEWNCEPFLP